MNRWRLAAPNGAITRRWAIRRHCREASIVVEVELWYVDVAEQEKKGRRNLQRSELTCRRLNTVCLRDDPSISICTSRSVFRLVMVDPALFRYLSATS